jgi:biopolymer transport protein ExbD
MHSHKRRLRRQAVELDITAFMNLIVVLVPFLLSSAVFSKLAILELNLPAAASGPVELKRDLQLEVVIRPDALEVGDRHAGLIQRIAATGEGHNYHALSELMQQLKARFPDKKAVTILAGPETPYDTLVQVMDAVRLVPGGAHPQELFPEISIGDAPAQASVPASKAEAPRTTDKRPPPKAGKKP